MSSIRNPIFFYVNSNNRLSGTHNNFTYYLPLTQFHNIDRVVCTQISIPVSYYLVRDFYDDFTITENNVTANVVLTPGNYSLKQIMTEISSKMTAASPNNWTYSLTYPTAYSDGKLRFSVTTSSSLDLITIDAGQSVYELLGFDINSINPFTLDTGTTYTLESTNCINLLPETTLFLRSNICQNQYDNVLQEVYTSTAIPFSFITYTNPNPEQTAKQFNHGNNSDVYNFYITDENNQIVDTNSINVNFTLLLFQKDDTMDVIRDFIQYYIGILSQTN